jgi:hypothetical protein
MNQTTEINTREIRGQHLANHSAIKEQNGFWYVPSSSKNRSYRVDLKNGKCTCADFMFRQLRCKHLYAAQIRADKIQIETDDVTPLPRRRTHTQNWAQYNKSADFRENRISTAFEFALFGHIRAGTNERQTAPFFARYAFCLCFQNLFDV